MTEYDDYTSEESALCPICKTRAQRRRRRSLATKPQVPVDVWGDGRSPELAGVSLAEAARYISESDDPETLYIQDADSDDWTLDHLYESEPEGRWSLA